MGSILFIPLFLDNLGGGELLVILFFVLIFFGSGKIPELAKGLGKGLRGFRNAVNDVRSDLEQAAQLQEEKKKEEQVPGDKNNLPAGPPEKTS